MQLNKLKRLKEMSAKKVFLISLLASAISFGVSANGLTDKGDDAVTKGKELIQKQKEEIENIMIDMNKTGAEIYDTLTEDPMSVAEAGCLDQIRWIDLDVMVIDPMDIWAGVYSMLKDQIYNMACEAANESINEANGILQTNLELPYSLGEISTSTPTYNTNPGGGVLDIDVDLDNDEVINDVREEIFGSGSQRVYDIKSDVEALRKNVKGNNYKPSDREKKAEDKLNEVLDIKKLWGSNDKDKDN